MVETNLLKLNFHNKEFSYVRDIRESVFYDELGISKQELFDKFSSQTFVTSVDGYLLTDQQINIYDNLTIFNLKELIIGCNSRFNSCGSDDELIII